MRIKQKIEGVLIEFELEKIKDYPRYSLYQVYKIENDKRIALFKECFTQMQINKLKEEELDLCM